jgi:hypothetical protein
MTKTIHALKLNTPVFSQHRSFRRFVRKMFACFLKHQGCDCQDEFQVMVVGRLQSIEDSIEIMAREMARQAKRGK